MKTTFRNRLFYSLVLTSAAAAASGAYFIGSLADETIRTNLMNTAQGVAELTARQALPAVLADNRSVLADITEIVASKGYEYAYIRSDSGMLLGSSLGVSFPAGLEAMNVFEGEEGREGVRFRQKDVWDIGARIPGGTGSVHVGLATSAITDVTGPLTKALWLAGGGAVLVATVLPFIIAGMVAAPLRQLTAYADAISKGEINRPSGVTSRDEFGDLATSLERMSASLDIMINESK